MDRLSAIAANWIELSAWVRLQLEDLESGDIRLMCNGEDVTAEHTYLLRVWLASTRRVIETLEPEG